MNTPCTAKSVMHLLQKFEIDVKGTTLETPQTGGSSIETYPHSRDIIVITKWGSMVSQLDVSIIHLLYWFSLFTCQ